MTVIREVSNQISLLNRYFTYQEVIIISSIAIIVVIITIIIIRPGKSANAVIAKKKKDLKKIYHKPHNYTDRVPTTSAASVHHKSGIGLKENRHLDGTFLPAATLHVILVILGGGR